jgi:hypothetical protein
MRILFGMALTLIGGVASIAEEISNPLIRDITRSVRELCNAPDRQGETWSVSVDGSAGATFKIVNVTGEAKFSRAEWKGIQDVLQDRPNLRECTQKLTPLFLSKFTAATGMRQDSDAACSIQVQGQGITIGSVSTCSGQ